MDKCLFMHLTLVPYIKAAGEIKTKPTQHSVKELRAIGIQADVLLCRCEQPLPPAERRKIALLHQRAGKSRHQRGRRRRRSTSCRCGCTTQGLGRSSSWSHLKLDAAGRSVEWERTVAAVRASEARSHHRDHRQVRRARAMRHKSLRRGAAPRRLEAVDARAVALDGVRESKPRTPTS